MPEKKLYSCQKDCVNYQNPATASKCRECVRMPAGVDNYEPRTKEYHVCQTCKHEVPMAQRYNSWDTCKLEYFYACQVEGSVDNWEFKNEST